MAMVAMLLYPPFRFITYQGVELNLGYGWLFFPRKTPTGLVGHVNVPLLIVQWIAVAIVASALFVVLSAAKATRHKVNTSGAIPPPRPVGDAALQSATVTDTDNAKEPPASSSDSAESAIGQRSESVKAPFGSRLVIGVLRVLRGAAGAIAVLQVFGMWPVLTWISSPSEIKASMYAAVVIKLAVLAACIAAFIGFGMLINMVHQSRTGHPHAALSRRWGL